MDGRQEGRVDRRRVSGRIGSRMDGGVEGSKKGKTCRAWVVQWDRRNGKDIYIEYRVTLRSSKVLSNISQNMTYTPHLSKKLRFLSKNQTTGFTFRPSKLELLKLDPGIYISTSSCCRPRLKATQQCYKIKEIRQLLFSFTIVFVNFCTYEITKRWWKGKKAVSH